MIHDPDHLWTMLVRTRHYHRRQAFRVIAGFTLGVYGFGADGQVTDKDEASLVSLVSNFSRLRAIAYNEVRDLKAMHKQSKPKLARSQVLYDRAKTAADTWIDTIRVSLAANGRLDSNAVLARGRELQAQTDALVEYAQASRTASSPHEKRKNLALIAAIAALVVPITDAAVKVYEAWSRTDDKQRNEVRAELDRVRWAKFQEI